MFNAIGWMFIIGFRWVVPHVLHLTFWANLLFGERITRGYALFMACGYFYLLAVQLLSWLTAFGLKRNYRWARPVGIVTSSLLLLGFPWLTILGAVGLYVLLESSPASASTGPTPVMPPNNDYWNAKARSKLQPVVMTVVSFVGYALLMNYLRLYAFRSGMPHLPYLSSEWRWLGYFGFALIHTTLHESGHAIVAWAVGFQLQVVSIGPVTFRRERSRFRVKLDPSRIFEQGGYMGSTPVSDHNLRFNEIAVTAAGPATNALTCLVLLAFFFSLPGTDLANWWWIAAYNASITAILTVCNLLPIGYCDGSMLFHLILNTKQGRLLLDLKRLQQLREQAQDCHGRAEFDKELVIKQSMLDLMSPYGGDSAMMNAICRQTLGSAHLLVGDWPAATFHYRKCLEAGTEVANNPGLAHNVWAGLQYSAMQRRDNASMGTAYATLIPLLESAKAAGRAAPGRYTTHAMLAQAHQRYGAYEAAIGETELAIQSLPHGSAGNSKRALMLRCKAVSLLGLADTDGGFAEIHSSAELFRSATVSPDRRNLAFEDIADLGRDLWRNSQSPLAIDLLREGIAGLESGGANFVAAHYRIKLGGILRQLGQTEASQTALPSEPPGSPILRRPFLAERAQIHLAAGKAEHAVADCRELVALWRAHPCTPAPEIASAEALLAQALLAAGNRTEADELAVRAADVLGPWHHPDAANCLITLALARPEPSGEIASAAVAEAIRLIDAAPLLTATEKERLKAAQTARLPQPVELTIRS
jgi:tetratricopeptide (TPR) repeat protein/Zn-dependent protease